MNIEQAKQQIENAMKAYFTKDEFGNYVIPTERQRPVFLLGAPGIGKTAIMEQIARDLDVGLVSYAMTHHTRQSAIGLPFITTKTYGGTEYEVSEYTMSEIIASVYDAIEQTGKHEGILFLDEINCVSETLTPAILQFLQYKVFGRHQVPAGWIVVTAGNPPEYNRSIHDFDIATWDRLKRIDVEPDFEVWKHYAFNHGVHPAILTYLEIKPGDFYKVETTVEGKSFVTARGWDDLSQMIVLYEHNDLPVDGLLVGQYVQNPQIAKRFAVYYDLFNKYKSDYQVDAILDGSVPDEIRARAKAAGFDERIALMGLLMDAAGENLRASVLKQRAVEYLHTHLLNVKARIEGAGHTPEEPFDIRHLCAEEQRDVRAEAEAAQGAGGSASEKYHACASALAFFEAQEKSTTDVTFAALSAAFETYVAELDAAIAATATMLDNVFRFIENVYGEGQEMLLLITDLSVNRYGMAFINEHGCERYFAHNKELLFYERGKDIIERLDALDLLDQADL
ncbi:MAG: AAA family ATPase [Raoultibacter sp.]